VLAGGDADAELAAGLEARALRDQIRAQLLEGSAAPAADPAREAKLIERARAAGLLSAPSDPSRPAVSTAPSPRRWFIAPRSVLAAGVLVAIVIAGVVRSLLPPAETFRGVAGGTVRLESRHPLALKQQLIEELSAAGVRASGYDRLGRVGIDADLPEPVSRQVRDVLERHHIPIPKDGALVVEIEPTGSR
jgi:hypothetical protein